MSVIRHNPEGVFPPYRCYSHAVEVRGDARLLVISGINGYLPDGKAMREATQPCACAGSAASGSSPRIMPVASRAGVAQRRRFIGDAP